MAWSYYPPGVAATLSGTRWLNHVLRAMGVQIGHGVVLGGRDDNGGGQGGFTPRSDIPVDTNDFAAAPAGAPAPAPVAAGDDDIPF